MSHPKLGTPLSPMPPMLVLLLLMPTLALAHCCPATVLLRTTASVISGLIVEAPVKAGVADHRYKLLYSIIDNLNGRYRESIIMIMRLA